MFATMLKMPPPNSPPGGPRKPRNGSTIKPAPMPMMTRAVASFGFHDPTEQAEHEEHVGEHPGCTTTEERTEEAIDAPQREAERHPLDDDRRQLLAHFRRSRGHEQVAATDDGREKDAGPEPGPAFTREREDQRADRERYDDRDQQRDAGHEQHFSLQARVEHLRDRDAEDRSGCRLRKTARDVVDRARLVLLRSNAESTRGWIRLLRWVAGLPQAAPSDAPSADPVGSPAAAAAPRRTTHLRTTRRRTVFLLTWRRAEVRLSGRRTEVRLSGRRTEVRLSGRRTEVGLTRRWAEVRLTRRWAEARLTAHRRLTWRRTEVRLTWRRTEARLTAHRRLTWRWTEVRLTRGRSMSSADQVDPAAVRSWAVRVADRSLADQAADRSLAAAVRDARPAALAASAAAGLAAGSRAVRRIAVDLEVVRYCGPPGGCMFGGCPITVAPCGAGRAGCPGCGAAKPCCCGGANPPGAGGRPGINGAA